MTSSSASEASDRTSKAGSTSSEAIDCTSKLASDHSSSARWKALELVASASYAVREVRLCIIVKRQGTKNREDKKHHTDV